jgi:hypothetical protein
MNNNEINPQTQYVLSYNNEDFYCNSIGVTSINNIDSSIKTDLSAFCKDPNLHGTFYKKNNCSLHNNTDITDLSQDNQKCALLNQLCENEQNFKQIKEIQTTHSASNSRYSDTDSVYKTELLKSVNLGIGILILSSIIYKSY